VPGILRHLLNPDSPDFRPDLKDAWDPMNKKQRTALLQQLSLLQHQDKDTMAEEQQEPFEVTWEHEDGTTDTTIAQPLASSAAGAGQQRAGAVSASLSVPASMIAGDHEQTQRASWEQEKLRDISATALEKLASISASRTSKLTPDANPKSDVSGTNALSKFREEAIAALRRQLSQ